MHVLGPCRVGDGDCGSTLAKGASAVQTDCASWYPLNDAPACLAAIAQTVRCSMGGTSGALYDLLFAAVAGACLLCFLFLADYTSYLAACKESADGRLSCISDQLTKFES